MNENKKVGSLRKRLVKNSIIHKYSNKFLFERREKNYNSEQNTKRQIKKLYFNSSKLFKKKANETKDDHLLPFYQTMSSFYQPEKSYNIASLLDYFQKKFMYKKKSKSEKKKNIVCQTDRNNRNKNLFITEISALLSKNIKKMNKTGNNFKLKANDDKNEPNIDTLLLIQSERNQDKTDNDNTRMDSYINRDRPNYKNYSYTNPEQNINLMDKTSTEYSNYVFNIKISKYEKNQSHKDYISKLNEKKIYSHISKAKTERLKRLEEAHKNQIEFYKDSINSFMKSRKLLENDFINELGDYARFISSKREREKIKQSSLRQKIVDYKKDIEHIKSKINKIEIEKKNIIKWIFLQIQMKEKKLKLPDYYKFIIIHNGNKNLSNSRLLITHEDKNDSLSSIKEKKRPIKKSIIKLNDFNIINNSKIFNTNGNNEKYIIKPEEYKRILKYKNNLIYKTPEEFRDRLVSLEKSNLLLLQYKDTLHHQLFNYKKELEDLIKDINKSSVEKNKIMGWQKEINTIKYMIDENEKLVSILKKKKTNNSKSKIDKNSDKMRQHKMKNIYINEIDKFKFKNISLYKSIYTIYEQCKKIENKSIFTEEIISLVDRKINTKEREMLLMLEFIELTVDYLIMSINKKMKQNNEIKTFIKEFKSEIEKNHKIDKAKLQVLLDLKKIKSLEEKVDKRINKIYFLPKRRISLTEFRNKKVEKKTKKEIDKNNKIEDFLYIDESSKDV